MNGFLWFYLLQYLLDLEPEITATFLCSGTRETIQLTNEMAAAGADAVLVTTPCFYKNRMNVQAMNKHYTQVCMVFN